MKRPEMDDWQKLILMQRVSVICTFVSLVCVLVCMLVLLSYVAP